MLICMQFFVDIVFYKDNMCVYTRENICLQLYLFVDIRVCLQCAAVRRAELLAACKALYIYGR